MTRAPHVPPDLFFAAAGSLVGDYLATDWASTPLGPVASWPESLCTAVAICLASRFPMVVLWGPELVLLYNEASLEIYGTKHPAALGSPCAQVWSEIWPLVGPILTGVLANGAATFSEDRLLPIERRGFLEECYFTQSYSPIPDDIGGVGGVFAAVLETTSQILAARRMALVLNVGEDLTAATMAIETPNIDMVIDVAVAALHTRQADFSDTAIYHCDEAGRWTRHGSTQLLGPSSIPPASHRDHRMQVIDTAQGRVALVPMTIGPCEEGLLACRLNPQIPEDSHLLALVTHVGRLVSAALSTVVCRIAEDARIRAALVHQRELLHSERHVAEVLQRSLLPNLPTLTELDVAARYAPGDSEVHIGGDWYDAIDLGAGRTALIIGDVMGHGVAAAAIMGQLRAAVRAYAQLDLPPAEVLTLLDLMVDQLWETSFVTCLYGVYDPTDRSLVFANAGHFAPLLVSGNQPAVTTLDVPPDAPLGSGMAIYHNHRSILEPGTTLALFTDGLVESRHHDIDDGLMALNSLLSNHAGEPLGTVADQILIGMRRHHRHDDDTALLLIRTPTAIDRPTNAIEGSHLLSWTVPPGPDAVRHGRAQINDARQLWGLSQDVVEDVQLVLSELITNALRYGEPPLEVRVRASSTALYLEVADASPYRPQRRAATSTDENGRGLLLVNAYSRRWGVRPRSTGKIVWAEMDRAGATPSSVAGE